MDSLSILAKMPDDMAGKFIKLIYHFQLTGELLEMDFALEMAITPFINQFERDNSSYVKRCETNRTNGLNGGRPEKQAKAIKSEKTHSVNLKAKKAYNDNDNDNDNDSNNDSESVKDSNNKNDFNSELETLFFVFNQYFNTNHSNIEPCKKNYAEWRKKYEPEQIEQSIINASKDQFWKDKLTPVILFRQKNQNKEDVDYIGSLLNRKPEMTPKQEMGEAFKKSLEHQLNKIRNGQ